MSWLSMGISASCFTLFLAFVFTWAIYGMFYLLNVEVARGTNDPGVSSKERREYFHWFGAEEVR